MPITPGREAEFTAFATAAEGSLRRTAWLLTGNADLAADLLQATLVKTYVAWRRVRQDDALAFARRVMVNENIDRWRKRHGEVAIGVDFDRPGGTPQDRVDDRDQLLRLLDTLPPQQRRVVVLRYHDDLPEKEVARLLNISVGAVKSAASRGLAALRSAHTSASTQGVTR